MKKTALILTSIVLMVSFFMFDVTATVENDFTPYVVDFTVTTVDNASEFTNDNSRASGLITSYGLGLSASGTTLNISGRTNGSSTVVKCGFKDLTVERRKTSSDSWEDYYEFGNVYRDAIAANLNTTLVVESGYQYRISCKHYAKKNLLSVQTIANTSNIVVV